MMPAIMRSPAPDQNLESSRPRPGLAAAAGVLLAALLATGCVYRIDIQQGNFLDPEKVAQLQPGMTRSQVRYLLGTPLASTPFGNNRWDYVYYFRRGHSSDAEERKVTVYFEEDRVTRIERFGSDGEPVNEQVAASADQD
jgi:outer membrane protein assembly factor BamE